MHQVLIISRLATSTTAEFSASLNHPFTSFEKMVCPKTSGCEAGIQIHYVVRDNIRVKNK